MRPATRGPALITALALLWGSNFAWIKLSLDSFSPTQVTIRWMAAASLTRHRAADEAYVPEGGR